MNLRLAALVVAASMSTLEPALARDAQSEMVIALGKTHYHRPGCALLKGATDILAMTRAQAEARNLEPHADCDPAQAPPGSDPSTPGRAAKPAMVLMDVGGSFYHRDKCAKLSKKTRRVPVTEAAKKHWPCRTCKPPIRPRR